MLIRKLAEQYKAVNLAKKRGGTLLPAGGDPKAILKELPLEIFFFLPSPSIDNRISSFVCARFFTEQLFYFRIMGDKLDDLSAIRLRATKPFP